MKPTTAAASLLVIAVGLLDPGRCLSEEKLDPALSKYYEANSLFNKKAYPLAEDEFKAFLGKHGNHPKAEDARLGLALSLVAQKKHAEAEPLLAKLVANPKHPKAEHLLLAYGQSLVELKRLPEAEKQFAAGLKRPGAKDAFKSRCLVGLVDVAFQQRAWKTASDRAAEFLRLPGAANSRLGMRVRTQAAMAAFELKDYKTAADALTALGAGEKAPVLGQQGVFLLAECKRQLGDRKGAQSGFRAARDMDGDYRAGAIFRLGYMDFEDRKFDDAIRAFEELRLKHPNDPAAKSAALYLGRSYFEKKDYARARSSLAGIDTAEAAFWTARAFLKDNRHADAAHVLRNAIGRHPKDPMAHDLRFELGSALLQQDNFREAADAFAKVENRAEALRLRGFCLHRTEDYANSLAACDAYLGHADATPEGKEETAFLRAENLTLLGRSDDAVRAYEAFLSRFAKSPNVAVAHARIGFAHYAKKHWKEAGDAFGSALGKQPKREGVLAEIDFYAGECAASAGDPAKALKHYETFLSSAPAKADKHDDALLKIAEQHAAAGRHADAIRRYEELARQFPNSPFHGRALVETGRLAYEAKDYGKARSTLENFTRSRSTDPLRPHAEYYLGWIALTEERDSDARKHFQYVTANAKGAEATILADAGYRLGILAVQSGDFAAAEKALGALAKNASDPARLAEVRYHLGVAQARQEKWADARKTLGSVVDGGDTRFRERALYELAWCEKESGQASDAAKRFKQVLADYAKGEFAENAALELAEIEYEAGNRDAATARLVPLMASQDRELAARAGYRLGWCHFSAERFSDAAKAFEKTLEFANDAPDYAASAAYQAGEARLKIKDFPAAMAHFARAATALEGNDSAAQALLRLSESQALGGNYSASLATADKFLAKFPANAHAPQARLARGWALENLGRHDEAIAEYGKVTAAGKRDATSARCQFQIGECFLAKGDHDRAIKEFVKVEVNFASNEWTPRALLEIGAAFEGKGDAGKAKSQYEEVVRKFADSPSAKVARQRLNRK